MRTGKQFSHHSLSTASIEALLEWTLGPLWENKDKNDKVPAAAAAKSLQSCPTLCDPINGSPPGSPIPGILQARTLEWVAISFSNIWKWKVKVKSLSRVRLLATPWTEPTSLLHPWDFPGKSTGVGCDHLLRKKCLLALKFCQFPFHPWLPYTQTNMCLHFYTIKSQHRINLQYFLLQLWFLT